MQTDSDDTTGTLITAYYELREQINALPTTRERALAITKLEECALWLAAGLHGGVSLVDLIGE